MQESPSEISFLFSSLIKAFFGDEHRSEGNQLLSYIFRLYNNQPKKPIPDYQQIRLMILNDFIKDSGNPDLISLEVLFEQFNKKRIPKQKSSILFVLYLSSSIRSREVQALKRTFCELPYEIPVKFTPPVIQKGVLTDEIIIKDLIFVLQGLDGNFFRFNRAHNFYEFCPQGSNRAVVAYKSRSQEILTMKFAEFGFLFRKLQSEINQAQKNKSLVATYLTEYFSLEINRFFTIINSLECQAREMQSFSLKSLFIYLSQEYEKMKWLNIIWDSSMKSGFVGCQIINALHQFYRVVEPARRFFLLQLIKHVVKPLIAFLRLWLTCGELKDENLEFFIQSNETPKSETLWSQQFSLNHEKTPNFWSAEVENKVFICGKTAYFLRKFCQEACFQPLSDYPFCFDKEGFQGLEAWIDRIYRDNNSFALSTMFKDFTLIQEMRLLKNYLLMCDGCFVDFLLTDLSPELKKPCNQIYKHIMMGILEKTLKKTVRNPIIKKQLLERLTIVYVKRSSIVDIGWDLFSLDLSFKNPLNQLILGRERNVYTTIFNFLVKIKRFQLEIQEIWRKTIVVTKLLRTKRFSLEKSKEKECLKMLKEAEITRNLISFFLNNFLEFLLIEGIESEWNSFEGNHLLKCTNLDQIIQAHREFLFRLQRKFMILEEQHEMQLSIFKLYEHIHCFIMISQSFLDTFEEILIQNQRNLLMRSLQEIRFEDEDNDSDLRVIQDEFLGRDIDFTNKLKFPKSMLEIKKEFEKSLIELLVLFEKNQFKTSLAFKLNFNEFLEMADFQAVKHKKSLVTFEELNSILSPVKIEIKAEKPKSSPEIRKVLTRVFDDDSQDEFDQIQDKYENVFRDLSE